MSLSMDEVARRLPALDLITDRAVRAETARLSARAPDYFWTVPATRGNYHHPVCREERGLWAHTLMVCTAIERLVDSYAQRYDVDPDHARAAAILHDQRKNGPPESPSRSSVNDHDLRMERVVREHSDLPDPVADAVATHMGPWYDGPEPDAPLSELVHNADMLASTPNATLAVPGPIPDELQSLGLAAADL